MADVDLSRVRRPDLPRTFKTPLVPIAGIVISLGLMLSLHWTTWVRLIIWRLLLGLGIYFGYGRKHSKLRAIR